jgi:hypothetical protein
VSAGDHHAEVAHQSTVRSCPELLKMAIG